MIHRICIVSIRRQYTEIYSESTMSVSDDTLTRRRTGQRKEEKLQDTKYSNTCKMKKSSDYVIFLMAGYGDTIICPHSITAGWQSRKNHCHRRIKSSIRWKILNTMDRSGRKGNRQTVCRLIRVAEDRIKWKQAVVHAT